MCEKKERLRLTAIVCEKAYIAWRTESFNILPTADLNFPESQTGNIPFMLHDISKGVDRIIQMASWSPESMTLLRNLALLRWSEIPTVVNSESQVHEEDGGEYDGSDGSDGSDSRF